MTHVLQGFNPCNTSDSPSQLLGPQGGLVLRQDGGDGSTMYFVVPQLCADRRHDWVLRWAKVVHDVDVVVVAPTKCRWANFWRRRMRCTIRCCPSSEGAGGASANCLANRGFRGFSEAFAMDLVIVSKSGCHAVMEQNFMFQPVLKVALA